MQAEDIDARLEAARDVVREAGRLAHGAFSEQRFQVVQEDGDDVTTDTDHAVEELIASALAERFPDDGFFAEERGGTEAESLWIVDPIDGTRNFARGEPFYCVSIAFVRAGQVLVGAIYDPEADELFAACRGGGATLDGRPIQVRERKGVEGARLANDVHPEVRRESREVRKRLRVAGAEVPSPGAGALAMAHVADGRFDAYWNLHIAAWDVAAALLIVREAGGYATSFRSWRSLRLRQGAMVCTPTLKVPLLALTGLTQ